jgi:hypothetical protein
MDKAKIKFIENVTHVLCGGLAMYGKLLLLLFRFFILARLEEKYNTGTKANVVIPNDMNLNS